MTASTAQSARICIDTLNDQQPPRSSPLYTVMAMANTLEFHPATRRQAWVIRGQSHSRRITAWPTWFARNTEEKPLLYLHNATSSAQLRALCQGTDQRGILCNDIHTRPASGRHGAHPSLALWLASNPQCTPYDPASGDETRAIVLAGLHALYVDGRPGFYYLALHDQDDGPGLAPQDRQDAIKGMYRIGREPPGELHVRLLGGLAAHLKKSCMQQGCWRPTGTYRRSYGAAPATPGWRGKHAPPSAGTACTLWPKSVAATCAIAWRPTTAR